MKPKLKDRLWFKCLIGCVVGCVACILMFFTVGIVLSPVMLAVVGLVLGALPLAAAAVSFLVFALLNAQWLGAIALVVLAFVPAAASIFALKRKGGRFDSLLICCAGALVGLGLYIILACAEAGTTVGQFLGYELPAVYADILRQSGAQAGLDPAMVESMAVESMFQLPVLIPAIAMGMSCITGFLCLLVPQQFAKKRGVPVMELPPFAMWMLPRSFSAGILVLFIVAILGRLMGWNGFDGVVSTVEALFMVAFGLQGIAVIRFLCLPNKRTALFVILTVIGIMLGGMPLYFVGVLDGIMKWRSRVMLVAYVRKKQGDDNQKREDDRLANFNLHNHDKLLHPKPQDEKEDEEPQEGEKPQGPPDEDHCDQHKEDKS